MGSRRPVPVLGPLEYALIRILWDHGPASGRQVLDEYNAHAPKSLAYTTVMTLLTRLVDKGVLTVDRRRQPYRFTASVTRERLLRQRVHDFVDFFFDGRPIDLALRLVEDQPLSDDAIRRLEDILRRHRAARRGRTKSGGGA